VGLVAVAGGREGAVEEDSGDRGAGLFGAELSVDHPGDRPFEKTEVDLGERLDREVVAEGAFGVAEHRPKRCVRVRRPSSPVDVGVGVLVACRPG
jgi:hypothetical protein